MIFKILFVTLVSVTSIMITVVIHMTPTTQGYTILHIKLFIRKECCMVQVMCVSLLYAVTNEATFIPSYYRYSPTPVFFALSPRFTHFINHSIKAVCKSGSPLKNTHNPIIVNQNIIINCVPASPLGSLTGSSMVQNPLCCYTVHDLLLVRNHYEVYLLLS